MENLLNRRIDTLKIKSDVMKIFKEKGYETVKDLLAKRPIDVVGIGEKTLESIEKQLLEDGLFLLPVADYDCAMKTKYFAFKCIIRDGGIKLVSGFENISKIRKIGKNIWMFDFNNDIYPRPQEFFSYYDNRTYRFIVYLTEKKVMYVTPDDVFVVLLCMDRVLFIQNKQGQEIIYEKCIGVNGEELLPFI